LIAGLSVLAVIPARGGSKGLPGKNIALLEGRPLIYYTIAAAQASQYIDRLVLSSDDDAIIATAQELGCDAPFRRPAALATDTAPAIDVVLHALDELPGFDIVVLLQPTSPLRMAADIDDALARMQHTRAPACVSVCPVVESPFWMYRIGEDERLEPLIEVSTARRQDLPPVWILNGAVYAADTAWLRQHRSFLSPFTVAHPMPRERSLDIDTGADFEAARAALRAH
jgi:CMP-N,N'-diacetyllegionaminic acid synthase